MSHNFAVTWSLALFVAIPVSSVQAADVPLNAWQQLDKATVTGERWDIPVGYVPEGKRFAVLGGRTSWGKYKQPRPYDVLSLDESAGHWVNEFPPGKDWGPSSGDCTAPGWKDERFHFLDAEGNTRPNWSVYGTFSLGKKYDYDPDTRCFYFYAGGKTFRYDPQQRAWTDLKPATHPESELGGILLWSSMCYDRQHRQFVLFGGGNVQTERGDPGTWTYSPATNEWKQLQVAVQPPQRANSQLVYDPVHRKVVLFGGDQLDQLISDTWTFDLASQTWTQLQPRKAPSPRAGHALLWLPKAKKVLLLGGYTYTSATGYVERLYQPLPLEAWVLDVSKGDWQFIRQFDSKSSPESPGPAPLAAAVDDNDQVMVVSKGTWLGRIDGNSTDAAGTDQHGVSPTATTRRTGPHDPAWFGQDVAAADAAAVDAELRALPANQFVKRATPKLPRPNMDWGSAVLAPELDLIVRFSGGHSAYSGTAPQVYNIKTDRYSLPFVPEYPLEYVYSNDQVLGEWSFKRNPWMTGHTYKSTGYDPNLRCFVFAPHEYTYFFDPVKGEWSRSPEKNPYRADFYNVTVCATPQGAIVWADRRNGGDGLWRLDATSRTWRELPLNGGKLPRKSPDQHGLAFDSQRNRLLFFSNADPQKGDVASYDLKAAETTWLGPRGRAAAAVPSRETVYLPDHDLVMLCARIKRDDRWLWLAYDCKANAWKGLEIPGDDPIGKGTSSGVFHNSVGMMYDSNRKHVWFVGQNSDVRVLKLDMATARIESLD